MQNVIKDMKQIVSRLDIPEFLKKWGCNKRMAEIGVRFGHNLETLLRADPGTLIGIDHWRDTGIPTEQDTGLTQEKLDVIYREVCMRFLNEACVRLFRCGSAEACALFPVMWFDFVYVDADHSKAGALRDMNLWWPKIRPGGVMAGHDYVDIDSKVGTAFGVQDAVAEFMKNKNLSNDLLHVTQIGTYRTWLLYKQTGE